MHCGSKIEMGIQPNLQTTSSKDSLPTHEVANSSQAESKLELFGFDSLVNILGLKRYECLDFSFTYTFGQAYEIRNLFTCMLKHHSHQDI